MGAERWGFAPRSEARRDAWPTLGDLGCAEDGPTEFVHVVMVLGLGAERWALPCAPKPGGTPGLLYEQPVKRAGGGGATIEDFDYSAGSWQ